MTHEKAKKLYPAYTDGTLSRQERNEVERHLALCDRCRHAFELLDRSLGQGSPVLPRLAADPFLPTRIRAMSAHRRAPLPISIGKAFRWSFTTLGAAIALLIGIYLGQALPHQHTTAKNEDPVSEFAASFSGLDLSDRWVTAMDQNAEGQP